MTSPDPSVGQTRQILEAVRALLSAEGVWIKGHYATSASGVYVGYWDSRACKFSLEGALLRVCYIQRQPASAPYALLKRRIDPKGAVSVAHWNDAKMTNLSTVLTLLNDCIVQLGGEAISLYGDLDD